MLASLSLLLATVWDWHIRHFSGGVFTACLTTAAFLALAWLCFATLERGLRDEPPIVTKLALWADSYFGLIYAWPILLGYTFFWLFAANVFLSRASAGLTFGNVVGGLVILPTFLALTFLIGRALPFIVAIWSAALVRLARAYIPQSPFDKHLRRLKRIDKRELERARKKLDQSRAIAQYANAQLAASEAEARDLLEKHQLDDA